MPAPQPGDVAAALSRAWGMRIEVDAGVQVAPWSVARYRANRGPYGSVIAKWVRDGDPNVPGQRAHPSQLVTESIALQYLASLDISAPRVISADTNLLILEDLGDHRALDKLIIEDGYAEDARRHLCSAARALGERHAATAQRSQEYYLRFAGVQPVDPERELGRFLEHGWERTSRWAAELGCAPAQRVVEEEQEIRRTLIEPGPFLALSNGDSATNNVLVRDDSVMIIDYEFAGFRHCLADLVDFYLPGPRFVSVADAVASGFEDSYREALSPRIPEIAEDRRFGHDLAAAALTHALDRVANFPVLDRRPRGDVSRLERLNVLERASDLAETRAAFPYLTEWCRSLAGALRRRWPDTNVRTDQLPAFLPRV